MTTPSPTPDDIRAARARAGLTAKQAAALVFVAPRTWQRWEQPVGTRNHRCMDTAKWVLFQLRTSSDPEPSISRSTSS